mmetsp:Transcript_17426/g.57052  ORF Transcript_17426/g.57052 Transcript_17426/m.57052 type:complete len:244 (+) Transcript_17426:1013-1744(+)
MRTAATTACRPGLRITMSAAACAASAEPSTAIPTSACRSAGMSLIPSPVIPTMCPLFRRARTMTYLSSGKTPANPSAAATSAASADALSSSPGAVSPSRLSAAGSRSAPSTFCPIPSVRHVSRAITLESPVITLTRSPSEVMAQRVCALSGRGGSRKVMSPMRTQEPPSSSVHATASDLRPRFAKSSTLTSTSLTKPASSLSSPCSTIISNNDSGAPLATWKSVPSSRSMVASVRLRVGSNGV